MPYPWSAAALLTGPVTAIQPGINAALARRLDHPVHASRVHFGTDLAWLTLVAGRMVSSLVLDRTGWLGLPQREVGPQQFAGVLRVAKR